MLQTLVVADDNGEADEDGCGDVGVRAGRSAVLEAEFVDVQRKVRH